MHIIFVHGWSVTNTDTYGDLPKWLSTQAGQHQIQEIFLGQYISFDDNITLDDIARAFQQAIEDALGDRAHEGFACITHSTGGPVVRLWMKLFYETNLVACPLRHLIMLAPANHGSALAQLGKSTLSRIKCLIEGTQPGTRVLDWLELGSEPGWNLNRSWLDFDTTAAGVFLFVLTGQSIDRACYDHLNSYTGEPGSDGVVRVAGANMNYRLIRLQQHDNTLVVDQARATPRTALGILPGLSHSGEDMGIIRSVTSSNANRHPTVRWILRCLEVRTATDYEEVCDELDALTADTQKKERVQLEKKLFGTKKYVTSRYSMLVFRFIDDRGESLSDYDLYLTGGPKYSPDDLPEGFFMDRQRNKRNAGRLTYFVDYDVLRKGLGHASMQGRIGLKVVARPEASPTALAYYLPLEFQSDEDAVCEIIKPNETVMIEIRLERHVDARVFRLETKLTPGPISKEPTGKEVK